MGKKYALPEPDEFGNYWFGPRLVGNSPALLTSRVFDRGDQTVRWMVYLGPERGFVWDTDNTKGGVKRLLKLRDPIKALKCLNTCR